MILETILSLSIATAKPAVIPLNLSTPPLIAASYSRSSFSSRSSFRSSYSRPSYSSYSRPSTISVPRSSSGNIVINRQVGSSPKIAAPVAVSKTSTGNVIVNRQVPAPTPVPSLTPKPVVSTYKPKPSTVYVSPRVNRSTPSPQVIRETYVQRDSGNILTNPFFWMYMSESNRNHTPQQVVAPVATPNVVSTSSETPQKQQVQSIIQRVDHNPLREFATFSLGAGIAVLGMSRLKSV